MEDRYSVFYVSVAYSADKHTAQIVIHDRGMSLARKINIPEYTILSVKDIVRDIVYDRHTQNCYDIITTCMTPKNEIIQLTIEASEFKTF
jgi:hypothetical protein